MYAYNVNENWAKWKLTHASIHAEGSKKSNRVGSDLQLRRTADNPKRTTRRKTSNKTTEASKQPDGKQRRKNTRRVQGSAKTN